MPKSEEFKEKKECLEFEHKCNLEMHELKMKELVYHRENNRLFHERELERGRIKSAEIRKNIERKSNQEFANNYHKN